VDVKENYFIMQDSLQIEFLNERVYGKSKVIWLNCNSYLLEICEANFPEISSKIGDTLRIDILSLRNDTLTYEASAYGYSFTFKAVKFR